MKIISLLFFCALILQSCQEDNIESGIYVSHFKMSDHAQYKWFGSYRLAGRDSLILKDDGNFEFYALCSKYALTGEWSVHKDTVHLHGDYPATIPHFYVLQNKRLHGTSKLGTSETRLRRILGKVE
jgi:hypothetical protein